MKITISKKYLTFPVNICTANKKVSLKEDDELLFSFDCKLDMQAPNFTAYMDVARFIGKTIDISISPEMEFEFGTADKMDIPDFGKEKRRPQVHFTVPNGWNNDPNGLILYEGKYHLFYQYNPASTEWSNMHWGHAVSEDLIHWEYRDITLFPDELGMMYSGCALEDKDNLTGLKCNEHNPLLLYYTAAHGRGGISFCQCLAYSTDGGFTFTKYDKNPIIPAFSKVNRDPKVVWVPEISKYLLIMFYDFNTYYMMTSDNLLDWTYFDQINLEGDRECPDIFRLECEGEWHWIIMGAYDKYVVGTFNQSGFVRKQSEKPLSYSATSYAAQSYAGLAEGEVLKFAWMRTNIPEERFSQQMGFPMQVTLEKSGDEYYLDAQPSDKIELLRDRTYSVAGKVIIGHEKFNVGENPVEILLDMPYLENAKFKLMLFGNPLAFNTEKNQMALGSVKMPISLLQDRINIRLIVDRCSVECYADGGKYYFGTRCLCDYNLPYVELSSDAELPIEKFECHTLKSIYNEQVSLDI